MEKPDLEMLYFQVIGQKWGGYPAKALEYGVSRVLKTTAPWEKGVLIDRYVRGLTLQQIGEKRHYTKSNAGLRVKKALDRLRQPHSKQILFEESNGLYSGYDWGRYFIPESASKVAQRFIEAEQADEAASFQITADQLKIAALTVFAKHKITLTVIAKYLNKLDYLGMNPLKAANLVLEEFYREMSTDFALVQH